jgi:hypothetical protein
MSMPQFPDPMGRRELVNPGATAHKAGLSLEDRVKALEQGAAGRPGPGVVDGSVLTADAAATGRSKWQETAGTYIASMYLANSGSPTNTGAGAWQAVADGGGTDTWNSYIDKRPSGVSAQVDTATNKRIDIRKTGLYRVNCAVAFTSIADGKLVAVSPGLNGATTLYATAHTGFTNDVTVRYTQILSLTSGDYLKLLALHTDSASEAYNTAQGMSGCFIEAEYIGPAT